MALSSSRGRRRRRRRDGGVERRRACCGSGAGAGQDAEGDQSAYKPTASGISWQQADPELRGGEDAKQAGRRKLPEDSAAASISSSYADWGRGRPLHSGGQSLSMSSLQAALPEVTVNSPPAAADAEALKVFEGETLLRHNEGIGHHAEGWTPLGASPIDDSRICCTDYKGRRVLLFTLNGIP